MSRSQWIASIAFVFLGLIASAVGHGVLERPGYQLHDWLQRMTAPAEAPGVALILVDQHTITQMSEAESHSFPFPRQFYGLVAEIGKKAGARAVAYDILFTEPSRHGVEDDEAFAAMLKEAGLPVFMIAASAGGTIHGPTPRLSGAASALGAVHASVDEDGVIRRMPSDLPGKKGMVPSLAAAVYRHVHGRNPASPVKTTQETGLLRFYSQSAIPFASFYDVVLAHRALSEGKPMPESLAKLKDRVWMVGYSAPGLFDLKPIPTDAAAPGLLVPATALANLYGRQKIGFTSIETRLLAAFLFVLVSIIFANKIHSPRNATLAVFGLAILGAAAATLGAWSQDMWMNPLPLAFGGVFGGGGQLVYNFQTLWRERLLLAKSLENSMSPKMVDLIRNGHVEVSRYGEQRNITVLFCDLGGYTSLSETMPPVDLVRILNEYFDRSVRLTIDHEGYVDKFIGDAVMAFWGAPIEQKNQARLALKAGVDYAALIDKLNEDLRANYPALSPLVVRIGVHSGPAVVGNIGAQSRHNYTAVGDTVNLASRLEGMAKAYDTDLIASEDAVADGAPAGFFEVDNIKVKGRAQSTRIYAYAREQHRERVSTYSRGLAAYYAGRWEEARGLFIDCSSLPGARTMLSRCNEAIENGPSSQWKEGVWHHDSK